MTHPSQRMFLAAMRNVRRLDSYGVALWELSYLGTGAFIYTRDGASLCPLRTVCKVNKENMQVIDLVQTHSEN